MSKTKLGQHFLIDKSIAKRQIQYAQPVIEDTILEVGPGNGVLTELLAEKAGKVIAVEKDKSLYLKLMDSLPANVLLIHQDILCFDVSRSVSFDKVVSNLPYEISSPFTFWLLSRPFSKAILMYQKEFAERMVATTGSSAYSRLSVALYFLAHCRILEKVSKQCFQPRPTVDSCIVELIPRNKPAFNVTDVDFFFDVVRTLFNHRRKQIKTTVKKKYHVSIDDLSFSQMRVEVLSPEKIGSISDIIYSRLHKI